MFDNLTPVTFGGQHMDTSHKYKLSAQLKVWKLAIIFALFVVWLLLFV